MVEYYSIRSEFGTLSWVPSSAIFETREAAEAAIDEPNTSRVFIRPERKGIINI
jgi:hypothetical protein